VESVASALDTTKGVVNAVAKPFVERRDATYPARSDRVPAKLALGTKSGESRAIWRTVGSEDIPSASGSGRVHIGNLHTVDTRTPNVVLAGYTPSLPDVRVLRCNWEPDSALRSRGGDSIGDGLSAQSSCETSWWLKAWIQSSSGYTPVAWSPKR